MTDKQDEHGQDEHGKTWQIWVGIFVLLGSLATVAYAFGESWWG
ncbi:MAG: hypothetical protein ACJ8DZ_04570 [Allosphingosinicella sp.]